MRDILAVLAFVLAAAGVRGQKSLLLAILASLIITAPAYQATEGQRSWIYLQEIVVAAGFIPWAIRLGRIHIKRHFKNMWVHLCILTLYIVVCTAFGYLRLEKLDEVILRSSLAGLRSGALVLIFLMASSIPLEQKDFDGIVRWTCTGLCLLVLASALHVGRIITFPSYYGHEAALGTVQYGILWLNRASLGTYAQFGLFFSILLMRSRRLPYYLGAPVSGAFLWLTLASFSRSNVLSVIVFLTLMSVFAKGKRVANLLLLVVLGGVLIALATILPAVSERLASISGGSEVEQTLESTGRLTGWTVAVKYLFHHPIDAILGVGFDCWGYTIYRAGGQSAGHNLYLHVLGELGLLGGIIYLMFFFRLLLRLNRARGSGGDAEPIGQLSLALLIALLVGSITAELLYPTVTQISCMALVMYTMGLIMGRLNHPSAWPQASGGALKPALESTEK